MKSYDIIGMLIEIDSDSIQWLLNLVHIKIETEFGIFNILFISLTRRIR